LISGKQFPRFYRVVLLNKLISLAVAPVLISGKQFPRFYRVVLLNKLISLAVAPDSGRCTICFVDNCSYLYLPS
jgi:hypothetical protein